MSNLLVRSSPLLSPPFSYLLSHDFFSLSHLIYYRNTLRAFSWAEIVPLLLALLPSSLLSSVPLSLPSRSPCPLLSPALPLRLLSPALPFHSVLSDVPRRLVSSDLPRLLLSLSYIRLGSPTTTIGLIDPRIHTHRLREKFAQKEHVIAHSFDLQELIAFGAPFRLLSCDPFS